MGELTSFEYSGTKHILVLHNSMSPYRIALFRKINELSEHNFTFAFTEKLKKGRQWKTNALHFDAEILKTRTLSLGRKRLHLWMDSSKITNYDVYVLNDHLDMPTLFCLLWAKIKGIPSILWTANTINALEDLSVWQVRLKRLLSRRVDRYIVPGSLAFEYIRSLPVVPERIHVCNNVVDNRLFSRARDFPEAEKMRLKQEMGLIGKVLIYCGQFIDRKGLDTLLDALDLLDPKFVFSLIALGDGEMRQELEKRFSARSNRRLIMPGFVQTDGILKYYAVSDTLILPAHIDTWGLVVNEAMAAGVPVIVSTGAGCHADLVEHGKTGLVFQKGDATGLSRAIETMLSDNLLRKQMAIAADEVMKRFTLETAARQFIAAVQKTLSQPVK